MIYRESGIPPHLQVLCTLRFLAEGPLQKGFSQDFQHPISQITASRVITKVVHAINELSDTFIVFPNTQVKRQQVQERLLFPLYIRIIQYANRCQNILLQISTKYENSWHNWSS